jgi:hypothetical protein
MSLASYNIARLMDEADAIDPGPEADGFESDTAIRLRDMASDYRHLADLIREHGVGLYSQAVEEPVVVARPKPASTLTVVPLHEAPEGWALRSDIVVKLPASWRSVLREVAEKHGINEDVILGKSRVKPVCAARQELMWRMRVERKLTFIQIRDLIGMDHSTVMHGVSRHQQRIDAGVAA